MRILWTLAYLKMNTFEDRSMDDLDDAAARCEALVARMS
eukprot:SAG11_NODE_29873_length_306_cov_0.840580_1_plen_38_part_01